MGEPMPRPELSQRQAQVAELVARGLPNKQIAASLHISTRTVENHIRVAASRIPGTANPRHRLTLFFLKMEPPPDDD
jgi:DNA-binding NarL/FixJ family response regulator